MLGNQDTWRTKELGSKKLADKRVNLRLLKLE